jgi:hypothetical protein
MLNPYAPPGSQLDDPIVLQRIAALRKRTRRLVVFLSFIVGIALGIYFYEADTSSRTKDCSRMGRAFPCAELDNAIAFFPFTLWLYTVPLGWALSWPIAAFVHRRRGKA